MPEEVPSVRASRQLKHTLKRTLLRVSEEQLDNHNQIRGFDKRGNGSCAKFSVLGVENPEGGIVTSTPAIPTSSYSRRWVGCSYRYGASRIYHVQ
ncbi:unnamed protein product [Cylicostephanus goldi]|uniref:Uncharacterized protein n=1 Tax=Cylicostephanus goldi TaxID=71465 RepID=A0A3P7MHJ3_CYLGO|nr:unnamed protein product [Cylicostephanus goldi]